MKNCTRCLIDLPLTAFGKGAKCKQCLAAIKREARAANTEAVIEARKRSYAKNRAAILAANEAYRQRQLAENIAEWRSKKRKLVNDRNARKRELIREQHRITYHAAPERHCGYATKYRTANPAKIRAQEAARKAAKLCATPRWADMRDIEDVYAEARYFGLHVDHIVPLQSKLVCGLHVWANLQLLTPAENQAKGNRYWPDMPEAPQ